MSSQNDVPIHLVYVEIFPMMNENFDLLFALLERKKIRCISKVSWLQYRPTEGV